MWKMSIKIVMYNNRIEITGTSDNNPISILNVIKRALHDTHGMSITTALTYLRRSNEMVDSDMLSRMNSEMKAYKMIIEGITSKNRDVINTAIDILYSIGVKPPHIPDAIISNVSGDNNED